MVDVPEGSSDVEQADQVNGFGQNQVRLTNDTLKRVLFNLSNVYLPAERIGINVFRHDLNLQRLNEKSQGQLLTSEDILRDSQSHTYPFPIEDYIAFLNNHVKPVSQPVDKFFGKFLQPLVPGSFNYDRDTDEVRYQLPNQNDQVQFDLLSSSLKSLYGLDLFVKNSRSFSWLFVDEPEMNLHPARQKDVVALLYELARADVHITMSTHSDYLVKSLINLMLADRLAQGTGHETFYQHVAVYQFQNGSVTRLADISDPDNALDNFDQTTLAINDEYRQLMEKFYDEG